MQNQKKTGEDWFVEGFLAIEATAAEKCYTEAIKQNSNLKEAYFNKGNTLQELKQYDLAITQYDIYISIDPDDVFGYLSKGNAFYQLGKKKKALEQYNIALLKNPEFKEAIYYKGVVLLKIDKFSKAIEQFDKLIKLFPDYQVGYIYMADAQKKLGKDEESIKNYENAFQKDQKKNEEAVEQQDLLLKKNSQDTTALQNKASALYNLQKYEEANKCYDEVISIKSNDKYNFNNKGKCLKMLNKIEEAINYFDQAIKIDSNYKNAYNNKGNALIELKKFEEAIQEFDKAIALDNKFIEVYINKGYTLFLLKKCAEGIDQYNKALEIDTNYILAYCGRAACYITLGDDEKAYKDLKQAQKNFDNGHTRGLKNEIIHYIFRFLSDLVTIKEIIESIEKIIKSEEKIKSDQNFQSQLDQIKNISKTQTVEALNNLHKVQALKKEDNSNQQIKLSDLLKQIKNLNKNVQNAQNKIFLDFTYNKTGIFDPNSINETIEKYQKENPDKALYFKIFYWIIINYFQAYRMAQYEFIKNVKRPIKKRAADFDCIIIDDELSINSGLIEILDSAINLVFEFINEDKFNINKQKANDKIMSKLEKQMTQRIGQAALFRRYFKKTKISNKNKEENNEELSNQLRDKVEKLKKELINLINFDQIEEQSQVFDIALTDVILQLTYLLNKSNDIDKDPDTLDLDFDLCGIIEYDQDKEIIKPIYLEKINIETVFNV